MAHDRSLDAPAVQASARATTRGGTFNSLLDALTRPGFLLPLYMASLFLSAFLMFWVQPLIAKMVLPLLGGTPMVWTTCMVFFQALLLAGYGYAHFTFQKLGPRRQALLHLVFVAASLLLLPVGFGADWVPPASTYPVGWILLLLTVAVGGPFFVLSATAPTLQAWFARSDHPAGTDPYFLYVTSNLGSFVGLIAFPLFAELFLTVPQQTTVWSAVYVAFALLIVLAALSAQRARETSSAVEIEPAPTMPLAEAPPVARRAAPDAKTLGRWLLLSFAPSSLLLGLTNFVTTDLAAVPMLWVIPLAAYLATFMIAFATKPPIPHWLATLVQPFIALPVMILFFWGYTDADWWIIVLHFVAFFITALVCHGELARTRPDPKHLTAFYLIMSLGGVMGGIFNAIVAPHLFTLPLEYPLVMVLALLLRPPSDEGARQARIDWYYGVGALIAVAAVMLILREMKNDVGEELRNMVSVGIALAIFVAHRRPIRLGLAAAAILGVGWFLPLSEDKPVYAGRNFFGLIRVWKETGPEAKVITLTHGTTTHGGQLLDPKRRLEPILYYVLGSPLPQLLSMPTVAHADRPIAVVGLGTGTVACLGRPGQRLTFYEIDPEIEKVARDKSLFTFLAECPTKTDVVLGDGRLTIAKAPDKGYAAIVLDAFTSDAVPIHLLTREALRLYLTKLREDGIIVFNISNRYLDLGPVLARLAADAKIDAYIQEFSSPDPNDDTIAETTWVAMARPGPGSAQIAEYKHWKRLEPPKGGRVWTDAYSNILSIMKW